MSDRYKDMAKLPDLPFAKVMAGANVMLKTQLEVPASAPAEVALAELDAKGAWIDILWAFSALLPGRERVWWACLAARDYIGPESDQDPAPLVAAEAWVFQPTDENHVKVSTALDHAYVDDDTSNCAVAALYAGGKLGPGDLAEYPAPAGASEAAAFAMNVVALSERSDRFDLQMQLLIDRAVDIARGGNGRVTIQETVKEESA